MMCPRRKDVSGQKNSRCSVHVDTKSYFLCLASMFNDKTLNIQDPTSTPVQGLQRASLVQASGRSIWGLFDAVPGASDFRRQLSMVIRLNGCNPKPG